MNRETWLTCNPKWQSPIFKSWFDLTRRPDAAQIKICGLGFFELYINGKKVSDDYFVPVWSNYQKRDFALSYPFNDELGCRIYYVVYDIKDYLNEGGNTIEVMLGNGWYRQKEYITDGKLWYSDELKMAFRITAVCGGKKITVKSGKDTVCREGFIVKNNIYLGETHDYSKLNIGGWIPATVTTAPEAVYNKQDCPTDRVISTFTPKLIFDYGKRKIYDAGVNITGWAAIVSAGETVKVRYAENINDGELDKSSEEAGWVKFDGETQVDVFLNAACGTVLHPRFTWHAFRYFEVEGKTETVAVDVVHSDIKIKQKYKNGIKSGNEVTDWLFNAFIRTQLNNMHGGVPSDCPHRERLGYTGDGQLACEAAMLTLDCKKFYKKWIRDILDCQDRITGHVQHTAPFYGGGGGPGGWGGAIVIVPYYYNKHFKDNKLLAECYPYMLKWLGSMRTFCDGGLIIREIEGQRVLGDWCVPNENNLPESLVNTYFYVKCMRYVKEIAAELNERIDLEKELTESLNAIEKEFYDTKSQSFCGGANGADAFGLDLGLGSKKTLVNFINKYSVLEGFDTGIFGTDIVLKVLADNNRTDLVKRLLSLTEYPSFGYIKEQGATTLWEYWDGKESQNHPMFGACVKYLL